ncbi:hypothetical protein GXW82_27130 [Streptacidiphilus sp. 4-A2]|nr:hypothetical protein [Streptacidiphilus sp. 4-A2]
MRMGLVRAAAWAAATAAAVSVAWLGVHRVLGTPRTSSRGCSRWRR